MSDPSDEQQQKTLRARQNLKRLAKAAEFEAYEDAELRREEESRKLSADQARAPNRPTGPDHGGGRRKGLASQRGK